MAAEDYLPLEPDDEEEPHQSGCKYCNKPGLRWEQTPAGWRLFEGFVLHECIDPFKVVNNLEQTTPDLRHGNHRQQKTSVPRRRKKS